MPRPEPPLPATASPAHFNAPMRDSASGHRSFESRSRFATLKRRVIGLSCLAVTIFLWTASNFLASTIFADDTYSKPYLVTYVNTTFFIIPLVPILILKVYRNPEELKRWRHQVRARLYGRAALPKEDDGSRVSFDSTEDAEEHPLASSQTLLLGDPMDTATPTASAPLTLFETAKLSLEFCFLWFLANYFVSACLQYTTVASSTILTSTSSAFTLLFGVLMRVEHFTLRKAIGILASLAGIILISTIDMSGHSSDDEHRGDFPEKTPAEMTIGNCLAFLSAALYGLYAVFMKKRISDESRVNMPLFFGLVGVANVVLLWPGFFILHFTDVERFELPPTSRVTAIVLCNSVASLISDLTWAYAVLLTSPLVVTVGLSLTIPFSLIGQILLNNQTATMWYWIGALMVVASFVFVNQEDIKEEVVLGTSSQHDRDDVRSSTAGSRTSQSAGL